MKNRIIALILVCVMAVTALAACDASKFNFAEDSKDYASVDLKGFMEAIKKIEIEDADFTANEATRQEKVTYNILASLTSAAIKNKDKLTTGSLTENDVLYFCYYCTYTDEETGKEYVLYADQMKPSAITTSTTKANHVIELATVLNTEDDTMAKALYAALAEKFDEDGDGKFEILLKNEVAEGSEETAVDLLYDATTTAGTEVKEGDTIVISYTRKPVVAEGEDDGSVKTEKVLYTELVLDKTKYEAGSEEAALVDLFLGENMTLKVGSDIYRTDKDAEENETKVAVFDIVLDDITYKYSEIGVEWKVEKNNGALVSFKFTPNTKTTEKLENNALHATDEEKLDIKNKELTYYVYPVSYVDVAEISAANIIKEIFGSSITTSSMELFASEEYKNGDETVKSMIETLAKIFKKDATTVKDLKSADDKLISDLLTALADAQTALDAAEGEIKKAEAQEAFDAAEKEYEDAIDFNIDKQIEKILAAKKADSEETLGDILVDEYRTQIYDGLKASYDTAIVDAIGDEVWLLIDKYVTIKDYPAEMVKEFAEHIYEQYEYEFYTGKYTTSSSTTSTESNYAHYNGSLEAYLKDKTGNSDYNAAIDAEAKAQLNPLLKIFALSAEIEGNSEIDITAIMKSYTQADEQAGAYKIYSHEGHGHGEAEAAEEEKQMKEAYENALSDAEHFLVDDDALKAYKNYVGKANYKNYIESYGETNIRAALQLNRLMYYLLSTNVTYDEDGNKTINYKTVGEGENATSVLDFRTISYVIVEDEKETETEAE